MTDCIFCKLIAGDIPAYTIYEDEAVLAFLDLTQTTKGHTLVVPKDHSRNLVKMSSDQAATLFARVPIIAQQLMTRLGATGINILQNNEAIAGQTVFHTHVHLIPRYDQADGFKVSFSEQSLDLAEIQSVLTAKED
jgi:histidine triad (HIT) family protein